MTAGFVDKYCRHRRRPHLANALPKTSFTDKYISSKADQIHKLKARDSTGRWAYYFVLVEPGAERRFLAALKSDAQIDLEDYGKVIASCYGESPDDKVKEEMRKRFGFEV